ncbi:hypothetical protein SGFS_097990 [Streptomyces graminofaciens]|uniref:Uncharacterized protein n=1 Tax=Streptomyces graminofaciens TaxID=68212 RepID=A0ABN5VZ09_9ACTN|nr:hypothetical protein SGFS_097990 [Streptomyces graminofaciens]
MGPTQADTRGHFKSSEHQRTFTLRGRFESSRRSHLKASYPTQTLTTGLGTASWLENKRPATRCDVGKTVKRP